jgi:hypothetical protein
MKKSISLVILIIVVFNAVSGNTDYSEKFKNGNRLYATGQYEEAAKIYNELASSDYESPDLYYNLGNCCYRMNNVGLSIFWYKKAELLNPGDEDIKYNLDLANLRVQNLPPVVPENAISAFYKTIVLSLPIHLWGIAGLSFFIAFLGFLFWSIKSETSKRKKAAIIFGLTALVISGVMVMFTASLNNTLNTKDKAVVISDQITLKSAPNTNGTNLFPVYEGFFVKVENISGDQAEIKLTDGRKGWIPVKNIKVL